MDTHAATDSLDAQLEALAAEAPAEEELRAARAALARPALAGALALGVLADGLLRNGPWGIGLPVWVAVLASVVLALAWRRGDRLRGEQAAWLLLAVAYATPLAWRDAELLLVADVAAVLCCLAMVGMTLAGTPAATLLAARVRDLITAAFRAAADAAVGTPLLVFRDADLDAVARSMPRQRAVVASRAVVLTLPVLLVFGALLRSADPMFAALVRLPNFDFEEALSHVLVTGFFAWIVGGWLRGSLVAPRAPGAEPERRLLTIGAVEVTTVLGALALLFAAFVLVQARWLFGGEAVVRQTTGLGYAEYARRGFFELMWVAVLTVPLLLAAHACIPEADGAARRRLRLLGTALLVLLGAMLASAAGRMALYVRFYGLSVDRVYASAAMVWVALVLAWLGATVLRGRPRRFAAGMVTAALLVLGALDAANPARVVARTNLARGPVLHAGAPGGQTRVVDLVYLARLGADAVPTLVPALLAERGRPTTDADAALQRCEAARLLLDRWSEGRGHGWEEWDWTRWNAARARARDAVRSHEEALRGMACRRARP